jgi:hypothetical protein
MNNFDIFGQVTKELEQFKNEKVQIAGQESGNDVRYLKRQDSGYSFSQKDTLNLIDLYYNSKFETGPIDSEGQRKLFLNICAFRADVASKQIDLDTKDFIFIPDDSGSKWGAYFIQRKFKDWARENYFGEFINELVENLPKYGTVVVKRVGKKLERVPLKKLVNQQDAKTLNDATYVIEVHDKMTKDDMEKYPDWDTSGVELEFGQTTTVYERYGKVPCEWYYAYKGEKCPEGEKGKSKKCVVILTLKKSKSNPKEITGSVLFAEEVKEVPYLECHWKQQDGRWLGIGEVENQFENQISRNMIANLRRRSLLWSSKKIFQSPDETVNKNLIKDVKDGDVLRIMPNGNITQVDMASRQIGEFQSAEDVWEKNSDQKSFTYEAATGESMPSGTPFRLGVILSNAVNSHFGLKKEKLGLFLKKLVIEDVFEIFKKENSKAHTITVMGTDKGMNDLRKVASEIELNNKMIEWAMSDATQMPNWDAEKQAIEIAYQQQSHLFVPIPDKFYDDIKHHIEVSITGEEIDTASQISSLTTIYQSLIQTGDPRAEQVLSEIMALTGKNLEAILGPKPTQQPQQQAPQQVQPNTMPIIPQQNQEQL